MQENSPCHCFTIIYDVSGLVLLLHYVYVAVAAVDV